jgi:phage baseplate assembly protein W
MLHEYYKIPLKLGTVCRKAENPKCSLSDSVIQMIHLIVTSSYGECRHNPAFGCEIWELDFENMVNTQIYRDNLRRSIQNTIEMHEPRLTDPKVDVQVEQIDYFMFTRRVRSRIRIRVSGTLTKTNEPIYFTDQFFIGPLSYY